MNEVGRSEMSPAAVTGISGAPRMRGLLWLALPLVTMVIAAAWFFSTDPLRSFDNGAPPIEKITFERTVLDDRGIHLKIRAGGSHAMTIAQVQVDAAFWSFSQDPPGALERVQSAWINIPYPWILAEAHRVTLITRNGATFEHEIPVAITSPTPQADALWAQALVASFVGIVPITIGLMFYPVLRGFGQRGLAFILALTIGLLVFLLVDTLEEGLELAADAAAAFQGRAMVLLTSTVTFLVLFAVGRRRGVPTGVSLATYIALGIGLHNFGEGMAIGAAFAAGAAGLGTFLVLGFALHNITEGVGIAAPLVEKSPSSAAFVGLALLAGAPTIVGLWLGSLAYAPQWSALALAIGAGAIAQVIVEVGAYLIRSAERQGRAWLSAATVGGLTSGIIIMYVTAMFVKV
jgi:zinc transporter ZupT